MKNIKIAPLIALGFAAILTIMAGVAVLNWLHLRALAAAIDDARGAHLITATITEIMWGAVISIAIGIAIATALSFGLSRQLRALLGQTTRLAAGDLRVEIAATTGRSELGQMSRALAIFKENALQHQRDEARRRFTEQENTARIEDNARIQSHVVREIGAGLSRLAAGQLAQPIPSPADNPFPAAYEDLRAAYNRVLEILNGTMQRIGDVAQQVRGGSEEITAAAQDLARRAETQAATLEQSAAALNQLTESVRSTAIFARAAEKASHANHAIAETGASVVQEAVQAMRAIEKSSAQITRIIGVIDDIAFQTNLLALNAGVEAARAGEAGRGFAVVASEVRSLAQRASSSAREIKSLISQSAGQVQSGAALVNRTGDSLTQILAKAGEVSSQISSIASAADEQSAGLAEVNTGVHQLDQVTQQNAAVAEQSSAAAHTLHSRADDLLRELSIFRMTTPPAVAQIRPQGGPPVAFTPSKVKPVAFTPPKSKLRGDLAGKFVEF